MPNVVCHSIAVSMSFLLIALHPSNINKIWEPFKIVGPSDQLEVNCMFEHIRPSLYVHNYTAKFGHYILSLYRMMSMHINIAFAYLRFKIIASFHITVVYNDSYEMIPIVAICRLTV
jgi:hypothetical protein